MTKNSIVAHTLEEGGEFQKGSPSNDSWHTIIHSDGTAFDKTLARFGINEGQKQVSPPAGCSSWKEFDQLTDAEWKARVAEIRAKYYASR